MPTSLIEPKKLPSRPGLARALSLSGQQALWPSPLNHWYRLDAYSALFVLFLSFGCQLSSTKNIGVMKMFVEIHTNIYVTCV